MAIRPIVLYGHPTLREKSQAVNAIDQETKTLVADLIATLKEAEGLGLAANQIGAAKRVFIVNLAPIDPTQSVHVFINPRIIETSGECELEEGCLSFPGIYEYITRPEKVTVRATDADGVYFERQADGMLARVILHENDHIDGKLFIDHLSSMARQLLSGKLKKLRASGATNAA
ncbi:MAG: peptide deformylase [Candidatus Zixiibacteriota bacterium]